MTQLELESATVRMYTKFKNYSLFNILHLQNAPGYPYQYLLAVMEPGRLVFFFYFKICLGTRVSESGGLGLINTVCSLKSW